MCSLFQNVRFHKISIPTYPPPKEGLLEISRGGGGQGLSKPKFATESLNQNMLPERFLFCAFFPGEGGFNKKKPSMGGL